MKEIHKILVIGGKGKLGSKFAQEFQDVGCEVSVADKETSKPELLSLIKAQDLILVSVNIENTTALLETIKPHLMPEQLVSDFTSVKKEIIPILKDFPSATISSHPLFGQGIELKGQNILLMPIQAKEHLKPLQALYGKLGLKVIVIHEPEKHDKYMAYIQSLIHFVHFTSVMTLKKSDLDLDLINAICSPVYKSYFSLSCRILNRDPSLYGHIILKNPQSEGVLNDFITESQKCLDIVKKQEMDRFIQDFLDCKQYLGSFAEEYSKISDLMIEKVSELKN